MRVIQLTPVDQELTIYLHVFLSRNIPHFNLPKDSRSTTSRVPVIGRRQWRPPIY